MYKITSSQFVATNLMDILIPVIRYYATFESGKKILWDMEDTGKAVATDLC